MATAGRKPLGAGHVDQLSGSERAKLRLATILNTLRGELKVADACQQLGVCQSRFFAMRHFDSPLNNDAQDEGGQS